MADNCNSSNGGTKGLQTHLQVDNSQHRDRVVAPVANGGTGNGFRLPNGYFIAHGDMGFDEFVESNGMATPRQVAGSSVAQNGSAVANGAASGAKQQFGHRHLKLPFEQAWKMYLKATSHAAQHGPNPPVSAVASYPTFPRQVLRPGQPGFPMLASAGYTAVQPAVKPAVQVRPAPSMTVLPVRPAPAQAPGPMVPAPGAFPPFSVAGTPFPSAAHQNGAAIMVHHAPNGATSMVPHAPNGTAHTAHNVNAGNQHSKRWTSEQWEAAYVGAEARFNDNREFIAAEEAWMAEQLKHAKRLDLKKRIKARVAIINTVNEADTERVATIIEPTINEATINEADVERQEAVNEKSKADTAKDIPSDYDRFTADVLENATRTPETSRSPSTVVAYHGAQDSKKVEKKPMVGGSDMAQVAADIVDSMSVDTISPTTKSKFQGSDFFSLMQGVANHEIFVLGDSFVDRDTKRPIANIVYEDADNKTKVKTADAEEEVDMV